jgi:thiosulfate reductase cytochrome b subunit
LVYPASETWVGALLEKALLRIAHVFHGRKFHITSRSSTSRYAPWTVFKSQFCGFAAQKYSTKPQLKNCRLARRYAKSKTTIEE